MAEPSSGKEENSVTRVSSFSKIFRSPARTASSKKSSLNPLRSLLRGRKSSKKGGDESGGEANSIEGVDREKAPSLVEEVKEVVETAIDGVFHREKNDASVELKNDDEGTSVESKDNTSSGISKESKVELVDKLEKGVGKANKEGLKEEYGNSKEELLTLLDKDKLTKTDMDIDKKSTVDQVESKEKKEENCVSTLALGLQHFCAPWSSKKQD